MKQAVLIKIQTVIVIFCIVVLLTGCTQTPDDPSATSESSVSTHPPLDWSSITPVVTNIFTPEGIYFPVEHESSVEYGQVSLQGTLSIDDEGYLRVIQDNGEKPLVIWPNGYGLNWEDGQLWIYDTKGVKIQRAGDPVILNGSFAEKETVEQRINNTLPDDCKGPYFLAAPL